MTPSGAGCLFLRLPGYRVARGAIGSPAFPGLSTVETTDSRRGTGLSTAETAGVRIRDLPGGERLVERLLLGARVRLRVDAEVGERLAPGRDEDRPGDVPAAVLTVRHDQLGQSGPLPFRDATSRPTRVPARSAITSTARFASLSWIHGSRASRISHPTPAARA